MDKKQLLELTESAVAWLAAIPMLPIIIGISVIGVFIGVALIIKPDVAIEIQKRFYAKINWRMEPISMPKELRNTRLMGIFIILFLSAALFFIFVSGIFSP